MPTDSRGHAYVYLHIRTGHAYVSFARLLSVPALFKNIQYNYVGGGLGDRSRKNSFLFLILLLLT
jgi:hypothetical protein